jgi:hypothetical protein
MASGHGIMEHYHANYIGGNWVGPWSGSRDAVRAKLDTFAGRHDGMNWHTSRSTLHTLRESGVEKRKVTSVKRRGRRRGGRRASA